MDNKRFKYLRSYKGKIANNLFETIEDRTGKLKVAKYSDVGIIPRYCLTKSSIQEAELFQIEEVAREGNYLYVGDNHKNELKKVPGVTLYGGYYFYHWGHFLVESLNRLWAYFSLGYKVDRIIFFADNPSFTHIQNGNHKLLFDFVGISTKVEVVDTPCLFEKLIVPDLSLSHTFFSKEYSLIFDVLKSKIISCEENRDYPKKIFLTRSGLKNARKNEINIKLLDKFFQDNGYVVLSPEKIQIDELIRYLYHAETVSSISGTLSHNIVFAPNNIKCNIIERHGFINDWQFSIDRSLGITPEFIDVYQNPIQTNSIGELYLYQSTAEFEKWIEDNNMVMHSFPDDEKSRKRELKKLLSRHFKINGYGPYFNIGDIEQGGVFVEAKLDADKIYGKWLQRKSPLYMIDYFNIKSHSKLIGVLRNIKKHVNR